MGNKKLSKKGRNAVAKIFTVFDLLLYLLVVQCSNEREFDITIDKRYTELIESLIVHLLILPDV